jgi:hypothetical protein
MFSNLKKYPPEQVATINCDASFKYDIKKGGWACWISYDGGRILRHGVFKESINDSTEAELKSCCNAFHIIEKLLKDKPIKLVFVNCDNSGVRSIIINKSVTEKYKVEGELLLNHLAKYEQVIALSIKGHQSSSEPRHWVNNWCDKQSRNYLKAKI